MNQRIMDVSSSLSGISLRNNKICQSQMKKTNAFLLVLLLSIIHVHLSINTQDNGLNPLTFLVLLDSQTLWLSEKETFVLGGMLIQSVVTMGIARFVIKWGNYPI